MKLTELEPRWFTDGLSFLCPHCRVVRLAVRASHSSPHLISNASDLAKMHLLKPEYVWKISGDKPTFDGLNHGGFENVTLIPSVDASKFGHWHGFITNGEIR